jgi:DNA-binding transcriptional LysR family regulator
MLALGRAARQAIDRYQGRVSGALVVGGSTIPGEYVLPALVGAFRAKHPEVSVSLRIGDSRDVSLWVEEGRVEVGVTGARPSARALHAKALMSDELVIVAPAEHPWADKKSVSLADVRAEPLVVRERGSGSREALERALDGARLELGAFRIVSEMGSTQAIKQAVRAGVGVSIISRRAVEDECRARQLVALPIRDLKVERAFWLVTHRDRTRSPLAHAFVAFVESHPLVVAS